MAAGKPISISDRLGSTSFHTDTEAHLRIPEPRTCLTCELKPCIRVCPAQVYAWEESDQRIHIRFENCLELGACRIACHRVGKGALAWEFPRGGKGVSYRFG